MAESTTEPVRIDETPRTRRGLRRFVVLALLGVLLAFVGSIAWYLCRPLTDVEQRLVGRWRSTTNPTVVVFTLHADRTITSPGDPPGRWSVHDNRLYVTDAFIIEFLRMLFRNRVDDSMELSFDDDDTISVNGGAQTWQRVSTQ
jgi:hypothetical protein